MLHSILKRLVLVFLTLVMLVSIVPPTQAQDNFSTEYDVVYTVQEDGLTNTEITVTLTNQTSQFIASSYTLQVGFDDIRNVTASDVVGDITPKIVKNESGHAISVTFNKKQVGRNNKTTFKVSFDTPNVARKHGNIWEINIPGIANPNDFTNFNVSVIPPPGVTNPTYTKPAKSDGTLQFTKEQLGKSGISVAFGDEQLYSFTLTYHVKNSNVFPIQTEIALPPSTNYQEVQIVDISPAPKDVIIDRDGNWLAQYSLQSGEKKDILVKGKAKLRLTPKKETLSQEQRSEYLKAQQYWQVENPEIKKLANRLKTPENIYKYVVETLKYDFSRVSNQQERFGAVKTLSQKDAAVCLEFTDLFITLSRAAGIPARELNGYAHTENVKQRPLSLVSDILHAWPEYYDDAKGTWVMVDPTWGNTTGGIDYFNVFDFDHFVFVRKGESSTYPLPAGAYKLEEDREKKDVAIGFSSDFQTKEELTLTPEYASVYAAGFPIRGDIEVINTGNVLSTKDYISIGSDLLIPDTKELVINPIPPFGKRIVSFGFQGTSFLTNKSFEFTIAKSGKTTYHTITVSPFVLTKLRVLGGVTIGLSILIISIITYTTWRIRFPRRRK